MLTGSPKVKVAVFQTYESNLPPTESVGGKWYRTFAQWEHRNQGPQAELWADVVQGHDSWTLMGSWWAPMGVSWGQRWLPMATLGSLKWCFAST